MNIFNTPPPLPGANPTIDDLDKPTMADPVPVPVPDAAAKPPTHTRDRDPADREAWKRARAAQLGHHR